KKERREKATKSFALNLKTLVEKLRRSHLQRRSSMNTGFHKWKAPYCFERGKEGLQ
ncbi:unnamed protein product, partial [Heterotrigona itama]